MFPKRFGFQLFTPVLSRSERCLTYSLTPTPSLGLNFTVEVYLPDQAEAITPLDHVLAVPLAPAWEWEQSGRQVGDAPAAPLQDDLPQAAASPALSAASASRQARRLAEALGGGLGYHPSVEHCYAADPKGSVQIGSISGEVFAHGHAVKLRLRLANPQVLDTHPLPELIYPNCTCPGRIKGGGWWVVCRAHIEASSPPCAVAPPCRALEGPARIVHGLRLHICGEVGALELMP